MQRERTSQLLGYSIGGLLPIAIAAVLVPLRGHMVGANVALVLVLSVVCAAVFGGWRAGALSAAVATATFDFWFTRPYLSLKIDRSEDFETAILLLVVGIAVGLIASRTRLALHAVDTSRAEIRRIHRVAELSAHGAAAADILMAAQDELIALLGLHGCRFEAGLGSAYLPRIERNGAVVGTDVHYYGAGQRELELPRLGVELPVWSRGQQIGQFVLDPTPEVGVSIEQRIVAVAIADQVGAVLVTHG